jgi:hypothetical protein
MDHKDNDAHSIDSIRRRRFLGGAAATAAAAALTLGSLPGHALGLPGDVQSSKPAKRLRRNINAPGFPSHVIDTYALAIRRLLALPPEDPRNWYRIAFTHQLDCPHGNWWFLPWHRAYIGWFERICGEITNTPDFALPYWDWTASPNMPSQFFQGVLDPANRAFLQSRLDFERVMRAPLQALWNSFTPKQRQVLEQRGYMTFDQLWLDATKPQTLLLGARNLTASNPGLPNDARRLTSPESIRAALAPRNFTGFGSEKTAHHSAGGPFGMLEVAHNIVHVGVGGLMGDFMASCDPIFWLHHANLDRLWDEWILLQRTEGLAELPSAGDDFDKWNAEPYEFFVDELGLPVTGYDSYRYAQASTFGYSYQGGTSTGLRAPITRFPREYTGHVTSPNCSMDSPAVGAVNVPPELLSQMATGDASLITIVISLGSPSDPTAWYFDVSLGSDNASVPEQSIGCFRAFGSHSGHHHSGDLSFALALGPAIKERHAAGKLDLNKPLSIKVAMRPVRNGTRSETLTCAVMNVKLS